MPTGASNANDRSPWTRLVPNLVLVAVLFLAAQGGAFDAIERELAEHRFAASKVEPTGNTVVVEIDARSLAAVDVWPWPRDYFASLIHRLREAGAASIAFAVDFSSRSTMESDQRLALAVGLMNGRVILPVYPQKGSTASGTTGPPSAIIPIEILAANATLGTLSFIGDSHGIASAVPSMERLRDRQVPSLAVAISGAKIQDYGDIRIDFSIAPEQIPTFSFTDVHDGYFDPARVRGRDVLVGGAAAPFGEIVSVPSYGPISSVFLQALAVETIKLNRSLDRVPGGTILIGLVMLHLLLLKRISVLSWQTQAAGAAVLVFLLLVGSVVLLRAAALEAEIVASAFYLFGTFILDTLTKHDRLADDVTTQRIDGVYRQALMQAVVEESFDSILIADDRGVVRLVNPAAAALLGMSETDLVGMTLAGLSQITWAPGNGCPPPFADDMLPERTPMSRQIRVPDGPILEIEIVLARIRIDVATYKRHGVKVYRRASVFAFRYVTIRKRAEEAERQALEEVSRASRAKSEFIANMSHELRTPLNAIIGFSELIRAEVHGPVGALKYADYATDILRSGKLLLAIVNDLLDVSQIESGTFPCDRHLCTTEEIFDSLGPIVRTLTVGRHIAVYRPDEPVEVFTDPRLLKQVLINLLSNAAKFTAEGGEVRLSARTSADGVTFAVADDGIGIPAEAIQHVTDPFYQVDGSNARRHEGIGLGLFIVARYVRVLGGRLSIESEVGRGTTVRVALPHPPATTSVAVTAA